MARGRPGWGVAAPVLLAASLVCAGAAGGRAQDATLAHPSDLSFSQQPAGTAPVVASSDGTGSTRLPVHGSVSTFVGSHGTTGGAVQLATGLIGNTGIRAFVAMSAVRDPDFHGHATGSQRSVAVALDKEFGDGSHVLLGFDYLRDRSRYPDGYGPLYGGPAYGGIGPGIGIGAATPGAAVPPVAAASSDGAPAVAAPAVSGADLATLESHTVPAH